MEFLIVLGAGVSLLGLAFIIWIVVTKRREQGTANWPHVLGEIRESMVIPFEREMPRGIERTYTYVVTYEYVVDGEIYTASNRNFLPGIRATSLSLAKAETFVRRYPAGSWIPVYYNPANPKQAALEIPRPVAHNAVLYFGVTNLVLGIVIVALGIVLL